MEEIWKNIKGYETLYQISDQGNVRALPRKQRMVSSTGTEYFITRPKELRLLKTQSDSKGYLHVSLSKDDRSKDLLVHRIVAEAFIDNPENKPEVNHKNGVKYDNAVTNLEWNTHSENIQHSIHVLGNDLGPKVPRSAEHCRKLSEIRLGKPLPKHHIDAIKRSHQPGSEAVKKQVANNPRRRPVKCVETGQVFESSAAANRYFGFPGTTVSYAVKDGHKVHGQYTFVYA